MARSEREVRAESHAQRRRAARAASLAGRYVAPDPGPTLFGQIDELFESAARRAGRPGSRGGTHRMGNDGAAGARAVKAAGGDVIVQNEGTAVEFGMPSAVIAAGQADLVLPLGEIPEIVDMVLCGGGPLPTAAARAMEAIFSAGGDMGG